MFQESFQCLIILLENFVTYTMLVKGVSIKDTQKEEVGFPEYKTYQFLFVIVELST